MNRVCLPQTELPGTSALFRDYVYHFDRVARFYDHSPADPESLRRAANAIAYPDERRMQLTAALRRFNGDNAAIDHLDLPDTVVVVTGQQVGLFSGPAYTIYKALTAVKMARRLTEDGIRAVPVFWLATEDHDFAEIDHTHAFDVLHRPVELKATGPHAPGQPVGTVPITHAPLEELKEALEGFLYRDDVMSLVEESYHPGKTFGQAFYDLLRRLLSGYGLVFIDPMAEDIRALAAPFLARALDAAPDLSASVLARSAGLRDAGYHAQVHFEPQTSLFFRLEDGLRLALRRRDSDYYHESRKITKEEMAADPAALSPNALLRPVMQDYLLPTVAYVGGPAELAYLAQSQVIYHQLLGRMPVAQPRAGFTILDDRSGSLLERYGLTVNDCFLGQEHLKERIAARLIPQEIDQLFESVVSTVTAGATRLEEALRGFDPTLAEAMARSKAKMVYQVSKNRRKTAREALRREQRVTDGAEHLSGLLFPDSHIQERYYSLLPFLAKHGMDLVDRVHESIQTNCPDHILLQV